MLVDNYGRPLLNLRISLTKPCNLHCAYCHAEGEDKNAEAAPEMTCEEILRIVRIAAILGISKVKLTGGEPLLRKDILQIVESIASIPGVEELSMTTNGTLLAPLAKQLQISGLKRVNISLPTIDGETYCKLTGGRLEDVLGGVKAAVEAGLTPVKLNMLVLKGVNDSQVPEMIRFARETGTVLQLIELEPVNISREYFAAYHKPLDEYEEMLEQKALKVESRRYMQNRRVYHLPGVKVEVVRPMENTDFCKYCTRLRVTSDGKLKPCLMRNDNTVDVLTPMRNGATDHELIELFKLANERRQPYNEP
ncbi:MAG: GTP 3',8-cyclase MoaA [Nitrososphaerota archaeon]|nr:GTP 3',8-cyclase MoaA [Candidatus Bathyarchaeota archaeon]MDW8023874.1 GTP 3',8-cyclase MoaA [Nitrososphaerota archaeon]